MKHFLIALPFLLGLALLMAMAAPDATPGTQGRRHIELYANTSAGNAEPFTVIDAYGEWDSSTPFILPPDTLLVVTDVLVTPNTSDPGIYQGNVDTLGGNQNRIRYGLDTSRRQMLHLSLGTGLVFANDPRTRAFATNSGACVVRLIGYLQQSDLRVARR